jgi:peptide/nickel transport system substrate-binding protein
MQRRSFVAAFAAARIRLRGPLNAAERAAREFTPVDPIWSTANISCLHGLILYDTLYGPDASLQPRPMKTNRSGVSPRGGARCGSVAWESA